MIVPGHSPDRTPRGQHPGKQDSWLLGLLAGVALFLMAGKALGLGKRSASLPTARVPH